MPNQDLIAAFRDSFDQWNAIGQSLASLAERLAFATVAEVLPGAAVIELHGEVNEDWLRILRVRRVRADGGEVLFDVAEGHDDRRVEEAIDEVNFEYLDLLLDLTGDLHIGSTTIEWREVHDAPGATLAVEPIIPHPKFPNVEIELTEVAVVLRVDGHARTGLLLGEPDESGDPTLCVWNDEECGGEALLSIHLGQIDFARPAEQVVGELADSIGDLRRM